MQPEQPLGLLHRRLGARPGPIAEAGVDDSGEADDIVDVPSWVSDGRNPRGRAWLSAIRADPGRSGGIALGVVGLVQQPGLVTLAPNARVADAVAAAGGPLNGADTVGLNLARHVADGEQIVVGIVTPAGRPAALGSSVGPSQTGPITNSPKTMGPVDLNTASVEQLDALPGVGPVTAAAIVAWRQANGKFTEVDQLGEVDGIGPARLKKLRPLVRI